MGLIKWAANLFTGGAFSWIKFAVIGLAALAITTIIGLAYHHYTSLVADNAVLKADNAKLELSVELQKQTIKAQAEAVDKWAAAQAKLVENIQALADTTREASSETRRLNELFSEHDLTGLSRSKPGLIQSRINRGTSRALRMFECASGAGHPDCANLYPLARQGAAPPGP